MPNWLLARYAQSGELVTMMESCLRPSLEIHMMWLKSRYLALKTRCAIDAMIGAPELGAPRSRNS